VRTKLKKGTLINDWKFIEDTGITDRQGRAIGKFECTRCECIFERRYYTILRENRKCCHECFNRHYKVKPQASLSLRRKQRLRIPMTSAEKIQLNAELQSYARRWKYGLTDIEIHEISLKQGEKCAICQSTLDATDRRRSFHIDHDHITNIVRGILCGGCNTGLGAFKDNIIVLQRAILYLLNSQGRGRNEKSKLS